MTSQQSEKIRNCYSQYCGVIKPLIAEIESLSESIPLPLFNEIRAFNDHVARCYYNNPPQSYINEQVDKAQRHITRITLDCFKCLNVLLYSRIETFDNQTRNIDLTVIDNGLFFQECTRLRQNGAKKVMAAKKQESIDIDHALTLFQEAYNIYSEYVNLIVEKTETIKWARCRFFRRKWLTATLWILSVLISAIVSAFFSCEIASIF